MGVVTCLQTLSNAYLAFKPDNVCRLSPAGYKSVTCQCSPRACGRGIRRRLVTKSSAPQKRGFYY